MNSNKPYAESSELVGRFAEALEWHGIDQTETTLTTDVFGSLPAGTVITSWSTNDLAFFIQINQQISGQFGEYKVSVVAERYGFGPIPFSFCRFANANEADSEAQRLSPVLARTNFEDPDWCQRYLDQLPHEAWGQKRNDCR